MSQFPGVSQDSTSSGDYHVRNEHANVQFRINGIVLPDGISGFSQFLETSFIGKMALITGALPAQYGLHNTAILDITSKDFSTNPNKGSIGVYGGSLGTITPTFEYGGKSGNTEYFMAGREFQNLLGLENPTSAASIAHDNPARDVPVHVWRPEGPTPSPTRASRWGIWPASISKASGASHRN